MTAIMFFCQNDAGSCASPINVVLRKSFTCSWLISEPKGLHWVMTLKTAARETTGTSTWRKLILMLPVLVHKYIANVCSSSRFACHICYIVPDSESRIQNYNNPLIFSAKLENLIVLTVTVAGLAQLVECTEKWGYCLCPANGRPSRSLDDHIIWLSHL